MKRIILVPLFMALLFGGLHAQRHMLKQRLFKVDPMSGLFKELRVAVEQRVHRDYFLYIAPYGYHQNWHSKVNERYNRPANPQKYYGLGLRLGARRYFLPKDESPQGFFLNAMAGYRFIFVKNLNDALEVDSKTHFQQIGFGGMVGYQWLYGRKDNIVYGFMGGFEWNFLTVYQNEDYDKDDFVRNWYDFNFLPDFLPGFRVYLGIEIGFAFKQRRLHW